MKSIRVLALALMVPLLAGCLGGDKSTSVDTGKTAETTAQTETKGEEMAAMKVTKVDTTIKETLEADTRLRMLWTAVRSAQMRSALTDDKSFTIFAPNNGAFGAVPPEDLQNLLTTPQQLAPLLQSHILGQSYAPDGFKNESVVTLAGKALNLKTTGDYMVNDAMIEEAVVTKNGVIYLINKVLHYDAKKN